MPLFAFKNAVNSKSHVFQTVITSMEVSEWVCSRKFTIIFSFLCSLMQLICMPSERRFYLLWKLCLEIKWTSCTNLWTWHGAACEASIYENRIWSLGVASAFLLWHRALKRCFGKIRKVTNHEVPTESGCDCVTHASFRIFCTNLIFPLLLISFTLNFDMSRWWQVSVGIRMRDNLILSSKSLYGFKRMSKFLNWR